MVDVGTRVARDAAADAAADGSPLEVEVLFEGGRRRERRCRSVAIAAALVVLTAPAGTRSALLRGAASHSRRASSAPGASLVTARATRWCSSHVVTLPGGPTRFGIDATGVPAPIWSGMVGTVQGISGNDVIATTGDCIAAINASTGRTRWVKAIHAPGASVIDGVTAGRQVVVVGTSRTSGHGSEMVYSAVVGLAGLDPASGRPIWVIPLAPDGQELPAVVKGPTVVVSKANGTLEGLRSRNGSVKWSDPLPPRCARSPGVRSGLSPRASIITGGPAVVVVYNCGLGREVVSGVDAASGRRDWTWRDPRRTSVLWQAREIIGPTTPPAADDGVVAIGEQSTVGHLDVPSRTWRDGPSSSGYGIVVLDQRTGHPLWTLRQVPTPATAAEPDVAIAGGTLCVAHAASVECWGARTGAPSWKWSAPERRSSLITARPGLALLGGKLFVAAPTAAAAKINPSSGTRRSAPGTFLLMGFSANNGTVVTSQGLPAYFNRSSRSLVVSDTHPPEVRGEVKGLVLVAPTVGSGVVEAIRP